ncbi:MAG: hypothetical protein K5657_04190 [Desulfovibrio sp.]|nr:hypothetical protein [Desulfovibrio sp.]
MKSLFFSGIVAAILMFAASSAIAATQTYDTKVGKFSVDVPAGWNAKPVSDGCQLDSNDGKNAMTIQFIPKNPMTASEMGKKMAESIKMTVTSETNEDGGVFLDGTVNGEQIAVLIVKDENMVLITTFGGPDRKGMMSIYDTIKGQD